MTKDTEVPPAARKNYIPERGNPAAPPHQRPVVSEPAPAPLVPKRLDAETAYPLGIIGTNLILRQPAWSLMRGIPERHHPALFDCWNTSMEGALAAHNHRLRVQVLRRPDETSGQIAWRIEPKNP